MVVNANISQDVWYYYKSYDLSAVCNILLDMYDITVLPATSGDRFKEVKIDITNENYLALVDRLGTKSRKLSVARLLEFGMYEDVLSKKVVQDQLEALSAYSTNDVSPLRSHLKRALLELYAAAQYNQDVQSVITATEELLKSKEDTNNA